MMMSKEHHILIGSVLKPVNDTRMYEKMALSLIGQHQVRVSIVGFDTKQRPISEKIKFYGLFNFSRLSFQRLFAPFIFFICLLQLRPQTLIVCTHELLLPGVLYKLITGTQLVYDIQEHYQDNILYLSTYPKTIRIALSTWITWKERVASIFLNKVVFAEKCYQPTKPHFSKLKYFIAENLSDTCSDGPKKRPGSVSKLLFTGTLSKQTGIVEAVEIAEQLYAINSNTTLTFVGYAATNRDRAYLYNKAKLFPFVRLVGISELVPHSTIVAHIKEAHLGLVCYPVNPANKNKYPTKIYEYLAHQLPFLHSNNPIWNQLSTTTRLGEPYQQKTVLTNIKTIQEKSKGTLQYLPLVYSWSSIETQFCKFLLND